MIYSSIPQRVAMLGLMVFHSLRLLEDMIRASEMTINIEKKKFSLNLQ